MVARGGRVDLLGNGRPGLPQQLGAVQLAAAAPRQRGQFDEDRGNHVVRQPLGQRGAPLMRLSRPGTALADGGHQAQFAGLVAVGEDGRLAHTGHGQ